MRLAEKISDARVKAALLEMARAWHNLADQGERNSKADLVYEPLPRKAEQQPIIQQQQQGQPKSRGGKPDDLS